MAPELISGEKYNNKIDIWALGCVIYELFDSGRVSCEALGMNELNKAFIHFSLKKKKKREHLKKDHEESVSLHTVDMMQNLTFCLSNSLRLFLPFPLKTHG